MSREVIVNDNNLREIKLAPCLRIRYNDVGFNETSVLNIGGSKNLKNLGEPCVLEDRPCTQCGECDRCDRDPKKQCDNCGQCLEFPDGDFAEIEIDDILLNTDNQDPASRHRGHGNNYKIKIK